MFQQLLTDDVESPTFLDRVRHERSWKWWHFLIILLIVFPYISVIVLFALVSQSSGDTVSPMYLSRFAVLNILYS